MPAYRQASECQGLSLRPEHLLVALSMQLGGTRQEL